MMKTLMSETERLADQITRSCEGLAWHGDSVLELLDGVRATQAHAHPIPGAHSIWELVAHITVWIDSVVARADGRVADPEGLGNFPIIDQPDEDAWRAAVARLAQSNRKLAEVVRSFPEDRLSERVPGRDPDYHDFYYNFAGVAQHNIYHAGQIALLKKMLEN